MCSDFIFNADRGGYAMNLAPYVGHRDYKVQSKIDLVVGVLVATGVSLLLHLLRTDP